MAEKSGITVEIEGVDEIKKALSQLTIEIQNRALMEVYVEAANIAKKNLLSSARHSRLKKSKTVSVNRKKDHVKVGYNKYGHIARFLEKGTKNRQTKAGANRGRVSPQPFILRSFKNSLPQVEKYIADNTIAAMQRFFERYSKRLDKQKGKQ